MDAKRLEKIKEEMKKAGDHLMAAEILFKHELYSPSAFASYNSAYHASLAAFITSGEKPGKETSARFMETLNRFSKKLDPHLATDRESAKDWGAASSPEQTENEALLRLYQTKEFIDEVKGFVKKLTR